MFDFFEEYRRADVYLSDLLSLAMFIWLSGCATVGYNFLVEARFTKFPFVVNSLLCLSGSFDIAPPLSDWLQHSLVFDNPQQINHEETLLENDGLFHSNGPYNVHSPTSLSVQANYVHHHSRLFVVVFPDRPNTIWS